MARKEVSSAVVDVSWDSRSPRVRWVAARSERSCASDGVSAESVAALPLPLEGSGRTVFVEAVGVVTSSSVADWLA